MHTHRTLSHLTILFLLALGLSACNTLSKQPQQVIQPPEWVATPPKDNAATIYGLGSGYDLERAKKSALQDIAGKLRTFVESDTEYLNYHRNGSTDSMFQQTIQTTVNKTKLSNYQVEKTTVQGNQTFVLLAMSRQAFIKDTQNQLDKIDADIELTLRDINSKNKLDQLVSYNVAAAKTREALPIVSLRQAADSSFNSKPYYDSLRSFDNQEKTLLNKSRFKVSSSREFKLLANKLKNKLREHEFQTTGSSKADGFIELSGTLKESFVFNTHNALADLQLTVKAADGRQIHSSKFKLKGSSVSDVQTAKNIAFNQFDNEIKDRDDIYELLGLKSKN